MAVRNPGISWSLLCLVAVSWCQDATAHGGVVEEEDLCVIKVDYLRAHFKIYQPRVSGHKQFCEDLPVAAESVFVMEYAHDALSQMSVDFRIIRDVTGKRRFARLEDVEAINDIEAATVYYQPPIEEPDVYTVTHRFEEEGDFIGIVSATDPESGKTYAAVFPFEVGFTGWGYWPVFIILLIAIQVQYLVMSGRLKKWFPRTAAAVLAVALVSMPHGALAADLIVSYVPDGPIEINRMHSWILHIQTPDGIPVTGATIDVDGGMPAHDHGLPTKPRVTEELGNGDYRLDGLRFHMRGYWEIVVTVTVDDEVSVIVIPLNL